MKIAVAGTGYVGLSNALLLSQHNDVWAVDILQSKIDLINKGKSPIVDREIEEFLAREDLHLTATTDAEKAYKDADFVIIATPTNYDPKKNYFDTSSIETVIELIQKVNPDTVMVIKSTVPVGYTKGIREKYHTDHILFSPEFLREGHARRRISVTRHMHLPHFFRKGRSSRRSRHSLPILRKLRQSNCLQTPTLPCVLHFSMNWILMQR